MTIPFEARLVDLSNLVVTKGSNFILTVVLFALVSRGMDSFTFSEFGYWWSMAIMIGGVLLGGLLSALMRTAAVHGSLRHLVVPLRGAGFALLILALVWGGIRIALPSEPTLAMLLLAPVCLFGIAVQAQAAVMSLLRVSEATHANVVASLLIVGLVPLTVFLLLSPDRALPRTFAVLAGAFAMGTLVVFISARRHLTHLFSPHDRPAPSLAVFFGNASSFTAVNIFSYSVITIDFTLFKLIGASGDFAIIGTGKVFFERFALPLLMVFSGAISLRVLRHPNEAVGPQARLEARIGAPMWAGTLGAVILMVLGYWIFARLIRGDVTTIAATWAGCASLGYLLFAANGVLMDVLVVRRSLRAVITHVAGFLVLASLVQGFAIANFGVVGWALGWLLFNLVVLLVLVQDCFRLSLPVNVNQ
jgi:hypothetical protein